MGQILYLNKKRVDLGGQRIVRKIQIGEVGNVSVRKSTFSYSVELPFVSLNIEFFEMLGTIGNTSRKPFENLVVDYFDKGVPLVINGFGRVRETSDGYMLNIYNGVIDLSERLKNKKLSELPLSDLNHILTTQRYIDSMDNTGGYIYAVGDFGLGIASDIKVETQSPSIFTHTLFRRIFESVGFNLVGDFFNTNQKYLTEVVTPSRGYVVSDVAFTDTAKGGIDLVQLSEYRNAKSPIQFEEDVEIVDQSLVGASVVNDNIVFSVAGLYKLSLSIDFDTFETFVYLKTRLNGVDISVSTIAIESNQGSGTFTSDIVFNAAINDEIDFIIFGSSGYGGDEPQEIYTLNYDVSGSIDLFLQTGGQLIQPTQYLSDIGQMDFVLDVIQRYGLLLHPIQQASDYRFKQYEEILSKTEGHDDWTDKIKSLGREKYDSGYAKTNKAIYKYPEEIVVPNNDGEMIIDNENAVTEKTMITSIFEIPNLASIYKGENTYFIKIWELKDSVVELRETPIKTMRIKRVDINISAALFSEVTTIDRTENIPILSLDDMSMQYFLNNNYKSFNSLVENFKSREAILNLTPIDIFNLDFFKLKYLKQTGRFYYLNNVIHEAEKLSKVELIEIFEFLQNEPPSQVGSYEFEMPHDSTRVLTSGNLLTNYLDPEFDAALKVKILSGFNNDLVMKQGGVTISSETEILFADLDLTIFDALGGVSEHSKEWTFTIADVGSGNYSSEIGTIKATVLAIVNTAPVADAGSDQEADLQEPEYSEELEIFVNGGASHDDTGEIISYVWIIDSKPVNSDATISGVTTSPLATLSVPNETDSIGLYVLKLTVEDEFGLTDFDTMEVQIDNFKPVE